MAENLNYEAEGSRCYNDSTTYCKKYGRLYDWSMAMKSCPSDWHLPNNTEWNILREAVGGWEIAGKYLKATSGWYNNHKGKSGNGEDKYGFSALPGGNGYSKGVFYDVGEQGNWFASEDKQVSDFAHRVYMSNAFDPIFWDSYDKNTLSSVRCVQD